MNRATASKKTYAERFHALLEKPVSPYPAAIFRIVFYTGLAFHFLPAIFAFSDNFGPDAFRRAIVGDFLFDLFEVVPTWSVGLLAAFTVASILAGIAGFAPRLVAAATLTSTYTLAGFNGVHTGGFILFDAFGILLLWIICGGGNQVLSVEAWLRKPSQPATAAFGNLLAIRIMGGLFVSGVIKLLAGWPGTNVAHDLFRYPEGFVIRGWAANLPVMELEAVGFAYTLFVLAAELLSPIAVLFSKTRTAGIALYLTYIASVYILIEAAPLFLAIFLGAALFLLPETVWAKKKQPAAPAQEAVHV